VIKTLVYFCLFLSVSCFASINDYVVKKWSTSDGLASQSLTSIVQDRQGYIWVGTQFGLSRFDGMNFTNFSTANAEFLQSNAISKLQLDQDGMLWIGSKSGLVRLDPRSFDYATFNVNGGVHDILADKEGRIWIAANGLYLFFNEKFIPINQLLANSEAPVWPNDDGSRTQKKLVGRIIGSVSKMALSPQGIWLVNERNLLRLTYQLSSKSSVKLEITAKVALPDSLAQTIVTDLAWLEGNLFLASEAGAYKLDVDEELRAIAIPYAIKKATYKIMSDSDGGIWASTEGRLSYRDPSGDWEGVDSLELAQTWFNDIMRDRNNNIWLASSSDGLWQAHKGLVNRHATLAEIKEPIDAVTLSPRNVLWVASRSGIGFYNDDKVFVTTINSVDYQNAKVQSLYFDNDRLFINTDSGLFIYDPEGVHRPTERVLRTNSINSINRSADGSLWFGTERGLYRLGYNGLKSFIHNAKLGSNKITYQLISDNYNWLGTTKGAYVFSDKGIDPIATSTALANASISSMLELPDHVILIGTMTNGLFYRSLDNEWHQLDASNGLPYGSILSLHYDEKYQHIWVSNLKGVYRMPAAQFSQKISNIQIEQVLSSFDRQLDGKLSQCCAGKGQNAVADTGDSLWYPSLQGLIEIPKDIELFGQAILEPIVESISTTNQDHRVKDGSATIDLDARDLTINYSAIDFYAPNSLEFRYQLVNFDKSWRFANRRREAIYTNLPPGVFTFELEVKRQSMTWEQAVKTHLTIKIAKRFDETIYFRLLIVSLFITLLYVVFLIYRNQERRKQLELEKQVESRTTELTETNNKLNLANSQLKQVSHSDELTGLRSRRFLFDQLPKDIEHYQRNRESLEEQGKALALVIVNLDEFSRINDAYGPIFGDSCLQQVATLLIGKTQGSDYVVRWSGDEFLLLLRDMKRNAIDDYTKNLCRTISDHKFKLPNGKTVHLSSSLGWAFYPLPLLGGQIIGWETSINLADLALHKVKERGRNGVATFTFDDQIDAFEFEDNEIIEKQLADLLDTQLAKLHIWMQERWSMKI